MNSQPDVRPRPVEVRVTSRFRIWIRFTDGSSGEVDLGHLAGRGVFAAWLEPGAFERAYVSEDAGTVTWPGELDLDPDVLYCKATGKPLPGEAEAA